MPSSLWLTGGFKYLGYILQILYRTWCKLHLVKSYLLVPSQPQSIKINGEKVTEFQERWKHLGRPQQRMHWDAQSPVNQRIPRIWRTCLQVQEEINPTSCSKTLPMHRKTKWQQLCAVAPCEPKLAVMLEGMKSNLSPIQNVTQAIRLKIKLYPNEGYAEKGQGNNIIPLCKMPQRRHMGQSLRKALRWFQVLSKQESSTNRMATAKFCCTLWKKNIKQGEYAGSLARGYFLQKNPQVLPFPFVVAFEQLLTE